MIQTILMWAGGTVVVVVILIASAVLCYHAFMSWLEDPFGGRR